MTEIFTKLRQTSNHRSRKQKGHHQTGLIFLKIYMQANTMQTVENKTKRNFGKPKGKQTPYLQRNKYKNYFKLLLRDHASKKKMKCNIQC